MSMDELARFRDTYFDECAEMLGVIEGGLLRLSTDDADRETVNAVFRAVHSIKGGGGTFGFTELVKFAHGFETVLDLLRSDRLAASDRLVDVMIRANDVLGALLANARDGSPVRLDIAQSVAAELRQLADPGNARTAEPEPATADIAETEEERGWGLFEDVVVPPAAEADPPRVFRIRFRPHPPMLQRGNEPIFLLRALSRLGRLTVACDTGALPSLTEIDPECLYVAWDMLLATDSGEAEIRDIFDFVADECDLSITLEPVDAEAVAVPPDAPSVPAIARQADIAADGPRDITVHTPPPPPPDDRAARRPAGGGTGGGAGQPGGGLAGHTIRVDLDKVDRLVNLVGEMVITQAMIAEQLGGLPQGSAPKLVEGIEELARHTRELQESVMAIRAQPVRSVFARMPRLVRELAQDLGKDVQLIMTGEATEVDKTVIENLVDPLTHMLRNSIDHGVEPPEDRIATGKNPTGRVLLSAQHRSGRILIEVADDGRGIDRTRVRRKAVERGLITADAALSDEEIDQLIFLPGFSTAETVSNVSGRGVGMDVVKRNITGLGGRISVHNTPGQGTRFVLSLPLTLAVMDGMVVRVANQRYVLPLTNIVESLRPRKADLHGVVNQYQVIMARGDYVRLVPLHRLFHIQNAITEPTEALVVLVETEEGGRLGLVVDEVLGQQQVVIKSLEAHYRRLEGISAATILGDGRVALILDVAGLQIMSRQSAVANTMHAPPPPPQRLLAEPA